MTTPLLMISDGYYVEFYGWDVIGYYIFAIRSFMQQYSWQVRLSFSIILTCILVMLVLMVLFAVQIRRRKRHEEDYEHCYATYSEAFIEILESKDPISEKEIMEICDEDESGFRYYDGVLYAEILTHIRMTMHDTLYFPNLQRLCEVTGAREAIERRLKDRKDVFRVLQMVNALPMMINEGLLAIYTSHSNTQIAQLARVAYCMCSQTEPYLFLIKDINRPQSAWFCSTIHRLLGWKKEQQMPMPPLFMTATICEDPNMAAFVIEETSYWGTEEEKHNLVKFFTDKRIPCRIAAVNALARLGYEDVEEQIINCYDSQPQIVRREMQKAIASFHSGKYVEFFANVYLTTPSRISCQTALECLYSYSEEGRKRFEELAAQVKDEKEALLFDQIRTLQQLHS